MSGRDADGGFRPFADLQKMLKARGKAPAAPAPTVAATRPLPAERPAAPAPDENDLFQEAMTGVTPLVRGRRIEPAAGDKAPFDGEPEEDAASLRELRRLVNHGDGFAVNRTPEYVEGGGPNADRTLLRRLHRGQFAIQAHIDLHGMGVAEALEALDLFFRDCMARGKHAVLVVHGRGLSSPGGPILKQRVVEWLARSHWRKWVIAFTSARSCDGGAGATYVLLRKRPLTRRFRKRGGSG